MGKNNKKKGKVPQEAPAKSMSTQSESMNTQTEEEEPDQVAEVVDEQPSDFFEQRAIRDNAEGTRLVRDEPTRKFNQDEDIKRLEEDQEKQEKNEIKKLTKQF